MDHEFWHRAWMVERPGFHEELTNKLLVSGFDKMEVIPGGRIFVPLCGKSRDMLWFLDKGYKVVGIELMEKAVRSFFRELGVEPQITVSGDLQCFTWDDLQIYVGDVFTLDREILGPVDMVYDRGALVAMPNDMRLRYAQHLSGLTDTAPQLVISYAYAQHLYDGPPFSIAPDEFNRLYGREYSRELMTTVPVEGGFAEGLDILEESSKLIPVTPV